MMNKIKIVNASQHNLKGINLDIPRNKLVVFTGISGSGKSSMVFDTIYAEAQRQFIDTLSTSAQRYLPQPDRPEVNEITGLSPVVVIDQKRMGNNPRSTVGTATEVYTYLRLLYSRCGRPRIGDSTLFSFNTPEGACPVCRGLGEELVLNKDELIDWDKSLNQGAIKSSEYKVDGRRWNILRASEYFDMDKPLKDFSDEELDRLLHAEQERLNDKDANGFVQSYRFEGIVTGIMRRRHDKRGTSQQTLGRDRKYFDLVHCTKCQGSRLNAQARKVKINGRTIGRLGNMELRDLNDFIRSIDGPVAQPLVTRINESLKHLIDIGVGYLSLNRSVGTLSGGEAQRVKMAKQLGNDLVELICVLDEPSVGLHPKDISDLVQILKDLRDQGNTVLVVEHDPAVIKSADQVVDIGPRAGVYGGEVVYQGGYAGLVEEEKSLTGKFLTGRRLSIKKDYRQPEEFMTIKNADLHNLKNVTVDIPKNVLAGVTGVAGAGKSTLINHVFTKKYPQAVVVDQSAVGRSVRSIPVTYINIFDEIRTLFSQASGRSKSIFSFNSDGGCPKCKGKGYKKIEMHFLGYVHVDCDLCSGRRYSPEVLEYKYRGKDISQVLEMTVDEAAEFFDNKKIKRGLGLLKKVGLGYMTLGQPLNTLSGGEAQRLKITRELNKKGNIYIFDEPTTGLHMADIEKLTAVLNSLVDGGNSVIVIEHNLDIIANCDWIIDLGPGGGDQGGEIVAQGTPKDIAEAAHSHTARYLKKYFGTT